VPLSLCTAESSGPALPCIPDPMNPSSKLRGVREAEAAGPDGRHRRGGARRQPADGRASGL